MKYKKIMVLCIYLIIVTVYIFMNYTDSVSVSNTQQCIHVPGVMYHSILKDATRLGKYVITPTQFENDIKYLTENGYTGIFISDLINYIEKGTPLPEKPILITFDDGYYNNYLYAYPILQKYNTKAIFSIIGKYSEQFSESGEENAYYTHITWEQAKEMTDSGLVELQNHSYDLHSLEHRKGSRKLSGESDYDYQRMLYSDLHKTDALIYENTGHKPTAFTYPFGFISPESKAVLREMGYKASILAESGMNKISRENGDLYGLKRVNRPHGKSSEEFFKDVLKK